VAQKRVAVYFTEDEYLGLKRAAQYEPLSSFVRRATLLAILKDSGGEPSGSKGESSRLMEGAIPSKQPLWKDAKRKSLV